MALLLLTLGPLGSAQAAPTVLQKVIVQLRAAGDVPRVAAEESRIGARIAHVYNRVLDGFAASLPPQAISALLHDPRVRSVTPDAETRAAATQTSPPWGLDRIDQPARPLNHAYSYDTTGAGVTVYVVDSGVRFSHKQFGGRVTSGYDFVDGDTNASDCFGHGTHVSGTVLGSTYGVAKAAHAVALRVWDCSGSGSFSDSIAAFDWVVAHKHGPSVINYSGSGNAYQPMDDAVARATAAGVTVVAAAGNYGQNACSFSPGRAPSAITVGATTPADARAGFSDFGSCVDLFAPGVDVLSSTSASDTASERMSGTSMATPHVTGTVARYLQSHPTATPAQVTAALLGEATQGVVTGAQSAHSGLLYAPPGSASGGSTRYQETAAQFEGWSTASDPTASGGTWRSSAVAGNTASFSFTGGTVTWYSNRGPARGIAGITLDGVSKGTVDLYAKGSTQYARTFTGLANTKHTLVLTVTGNKNAASTGRSVVVDRFAVGTATTQESANSVGYNSWKGGASAGASGGAYRSSTTAGARLHLPFSGTSVDWITATGPGWGRAQVLIDGVNQGTVDLYAAAAHWQVVKTYGGLAAGSHTIVVQVLGTKNASATSTNVGVDGFVVR